MVYAGDSPRAKIRLDANDIEVHPYISKPAPVHPVEFDIPAAELVAPGDPFRSVMLYRVSKLGGGRMPQVGSGVVGNPITFRAPDGKQYVAVYAGIGGDWALLSGDVRADDPNDVRAPADYMKDIARHTSQGGMIWIFGL